ncbi:hypothetical protein FPOA_05813 [Fusarium poae]|uniref:Hydrophobin n=1 Tax=Fusarium poae TaxID=36050 RepID=A0A1B8AXQ1_FUSPO|nr:hypothetical protein FPOA_05813 [Fusarium poae]
MRFTALLLPIVFGAVSAGPCRPSSAESSAETTELVSATATATLSTGAATTAVATIEIESASTTALGIVESTTESAAATSSMTAASGQCIAPASLQCCHYVGTVNDAPISLILGLLGIIIKDTSTRVGQTCQSVPNRESCGSVPVCCNDNTHGGLIAIGCTSV